MRRARRVAMLVTSLGLVALFASCSAQSDAAAPIASPGAATATAAPSLVSDSVAVQCYAGAGYTSAKSWRIPITSDGRPDFSSAWADRPHSCNSTIARSPGTSIERSAYTTSQYTGGSIGTLYNLCTAVDPDDVYATPGFSASESQVPEIKAALLLCPKHPHAAAWMEAAGKGASEASLEASEKSFTSGTYLVGSEIQPGTYYSEGSIENCYWERQDASGRPIDNNFVASARRVQVSISASDYAFGSRGCGQWRPTS